MNRIAPSFLVGGGGVAAHPDVGAATGFSTSGVENAMGGTTFTFVTEGIEAALDQARTAAGDGHVAVAGGANVVQQYLGPELLHEIRIHLVPVLLGAGARLFDADLATAPVSLECTSTVESPTGVRHLGYRVVR